uniref:non-specific serine/threonine protein kinase n=1 Tax=Monodelphis domestica TaxID=13616 RepID=F7EGK9_MONDO
VYRSVLEEYGYEVGKVIGNGSYGTVYEAYYTKQKVTVAVKIISKKKASDDYLNKFLPREIQVMKVLRHKFLINFYQAIETTSRVYMILELAQGGDVLEWIQRYGACSEALAGKWFSQVTLGIAYLHSKGIVHRPSAAGRDLKLENLLLDKRENVKISDFGFSKMVATVSPTLKNPLQHLVGCFSHLSQTYCGSFAYACPEILLGLPYNPFLSDTWSMGVILYTLVVAHLPFDDTNLKKLLRETQKEVNFPHNHPISPDCKVLAPLGGLGASSAMASLSPAPEPDSLDTSPGCQAGLHPGHHQGSLGAQVPAREAHPRNPAARGSVPTTNQHTDSGGCKLSRTGEGGRERGD